MQYLLTEEEYDSLRQAASNAEKEQRSTIQRLCTMVADTMPIEGWHADSEHRQFNKKSTGEKPKAPWGCVITQAATGNPDWYCDRCPVIELCPHPSKPISQ